MKAQDQINRNLEKHKKNPKDKKCVWLAGCFSHSFLQINSYMKMVAHQSWMS